MTELILKNTLSRIATRKETLYKHCCMNYESLCSRGSNVFLSIKHNLTFPFLFDGALFLVRPYFLLWRCFSHRWRINMKGIDHFFAILIVSTELNFFDINNVNSIPC